MRRPRAALIVCAAVAVLSGCSGSSGGSAPTTSAASAKARYLAQAEAICASSTAELARVKKTQPTNADLLPAYVKAIVDVGRKNVQQLAALTPPPADKAELQAKVLTPLQGQVVVGDAYTAKVTTAVKGKDPGLLGLLTSPPTQTKADLAFMRSYGFTSCVTAADTAHS